MKILTSKIVNGKKMFLIEDNDSQGRVFAQDDKPIKKENISYYNPYYVDIKGINSSDNVSTKLTPSKKITPQELKQIKESPTNVGNIVLKEKQEKAQRLKEAEEAYQKRKSGAPVTPELLAQETQAIGDKISLQNIPGVGQYIPDILDVTGGIGSMASGLGAIPLNLNRGNYGQALLSVASPLAMGALAGVDSPTVGQFVNNIVNPLAGTGDLINNLGNKYLPNAYKLFKPNLEMMYRGIGKEGMEDALESGVFRAKQNQTFKSYSENFLPRKGFPEVNKQNVEELSKKFQSEYSDYIKSAIGQERFNLSFPDNPDFYKNYVSRTIKNLDKPGIVGNIPTEVMPFTIRPETMNSFGEYIPKPTMKFVKQSTPNHLASYSYQNPIKKHLGRSYIGEGMNAETLFHELGHQRTNASELIPKSFKTEVKDKKNFRKDGDFSYKDEVFNGNMSYYTDPSEVETRLQLMRRDLKELGIHDYTLSHPTEKHIMKIKKLSDENSNKISRGTKDLMELYDAKVILEWLKKLPVAVPAFIGLQQLNQEKEFGGTMKVLDTKIENNKKYYLINE